MIAPVQLWPPTAGTYQTKLVAGGPFVPVRIWFGAPIVDGEALDRSPRWCVAIDGATDRLEQDKESGYRCRVPLDPLAVWPHCARYPISAANYEYMVAHSAWAKDVPDHPKAKPRKRVDFLTMRLPI